LDTERSEQSRLEVPQRLRLLRGRLRCLEAPQVELALLELNAVVVLKLITWLRRRSGTQKHSVFPLAHVQNVRIIPYRGRQN